MKFYQIKWKDMNRKERWMLVFAVAVELSIIFMVIGIVASMDKEPQPAKQIEEQHHVTGAEVAMALSTKSKLYTAEVKATKTMHYDSRNAIGIELFGRKTTMRLPFGHMEAYIPVTAHYKASIDLSKIDSTRINIMNDSTILVILPDPVIEQTAVSIDHDKTTLRREIWAKELDDATFQRVVARAKTDIWNDITDEQFAEIIETAKVSSTEVLLPVLQGFGFKSITVGFRNDLDVKKGRSFLKEKKG